MGFTETKQCKLPSTVKESGYRIMNRRSGIGWCCPTVFKKHLYTWDQTSVQKIFKKYNKIKEFCKNNEYPTK